MITPDGTRQFFEDLGLSIEDVSYREKFRSERGVSDKGF